MADVTYYFDSYDAGETWATSPANMTDGDTGTFASASTNGDTQLLNGNTCDGSDMGTITAVEYRVYGYNSDTTRVNIETTPIFSGGNGPTANVCDWTAAAWSDYVDITSVTNAPNPWTWSAVDALAMRVNMARALAQARYAYVARIELRVTYTPAAPDGGPRALRGLHVPGLNLWQPGRRY